MFEKLNKKMAMAALTLTLVCGGGCAIDKSHYIYDQQAYQLVSPLALKEIDDAILFLGNQRDAGTITDVDYMDKMESLRWKQKGIKAWRFGSRG